MIKDISGKKIGMLEVKEYVGGSFWLCLCECGNEKKIRTGHLNAGYFKSCGCLHPRHGHAKVRTREYNSYYNMMARCHKESNNRYKDYGGKGITVCERWKGSFINFIADMGLCPEGHQIDRTDNRGIYEPSNCRWVTPKENMANRELTYYWSTPNGIFMSSFDAAVSHGVSSGTIIHWSGIRKHPKGGFYKGKEGFNRTQKQLFEEGIL